MKKNKFEKYGCSSFKLVLGLMGLMGAGSALADCTFPNNYNGATGCYGTVSVSNLSQLQGYLAGYGKVGTGKYKNLQIAFSMNQVEIKIHSPCAITFKPELFFNAENQICITAEKDIGGAARLDLSADQITFLSRQGRVEVGAEGLINSDSILLEGEKDVIIGARSEVYATDSISLTSNKGEAVIAADAQVDTDLLNMNGYSSASIRDSSEVEVGLKATLATTQASSDKGVQFLSNVILGAKSLDARSASRLKASAGARLEIDGLLTLSGGTCDLSPSAKFWFVPTLASGSCIP